MAKAQKWLAMREIMECLKNMNLCPALHLKLISSQDEILWLYSEVGAESLWLLNEA